MATVTLTEEQTDAVVELILATLNDTDDSNELSDEELDETISFWDNIIIALGRPISTYGYGD